MNTFLLAASDLICQVLDPLDFVLEPSGIVYHASLLLALAIAATVAQIGTGIYKAAKGRKMEKQAVSDREMYINTIGSWVEDKQKQQTKWLGYIEGGVPGAGGKGTVGQLPSSSSKKGRGDISERLSSYTDTLGKATSRISETDLMKKKFGLG